MRTILLTLFIAVAAFGPVVARADDPQKPITTLPGELGDLLRQWAAEGTAAGTFGDWYDHRDGGHSDLDTSPWPQLQRISYSEDDKKAKRDWAAQQTLIQGKVVFGNSSTSGPVHHNGSNVRTYYTHPQGLPFLYAQYRANNLYTYPEHHDHDPGRHGDPGYGDLFATNTPYVIVSQGSSGSDQPFMRMMPTTLAAFRPEVKTRLVQTGLLMPTVQMIFRMSNKHLSGADEYLTGKAHPTVFDGAWVNELKMARLAHEIEARNVPPMVQLLVVEEDAEPTPGHDYFDVGTAEKLADTPAAIARVWRGTRRDRRMVVSAEASGDANGHTLKYHWVLLRGDPERVMITKRNDAGSVAEIKLAYPQRRPVQPGAELESPRVDVGVFVHNGTYFSAPGFVTFFTLENESRTYDEQGRIIEIGYSSGDARLVPNNLPALVRAIRAAQAGLEPITKAAPPALLEAICGDWGEKYDRAAAELTAAQDGQKAAKGDAEKKLADETVAAANRAVDELLNQQPAGVTKPMRAAIESWLTTVATTLPTDDPKELVKAIMSVAPEAKREALRGALDRLTKLGIIKRAGDGFAASALPGAKEPLSKFALAELRRLHAEAIALAVGPELVSARFDEYVVDFRLAAPKRWRDVYRYGDDGKLLGWTRHLPDAAPMDFDPDGMHVLERDAKGRRVKAKVVNYQREQGNGFPLKQVLDPKVSHYAYENDAHRTGRVERVETP